jgi:hypothetical protein
MAIGKNKRKRLARASFHAATDSAQDMPYCLHVIEYRDGKRRHIRFASLTSFKEYRERFHAAGIVGTLSLVSDLDTLDDSKGKANRSRVINKGIGINTDKMSQPAFVSKRPQRHAIDGHRTKPEDFQNAYASEQRKKEAIRLEQVRLDRSHDLAAIRRKYRSK